MTSRLRFWLAVAVQVLVLAGIVGVHSYTIATGRPVVLKTQPLYAWNLSSGGTAFIRYDVSTFTEGQIPMTGTPYQRNETLWVTLQEGQPYWTAVAVSNRRPTLAPNQVAIRGRLLTAPPPPKEAGLPDKPWEYIVDYGIEQFYVPEGAVHLGPDQSVQLTVEAVVDSSGRAALHRILLDGKELKWQ